MCTTSVCLGIVKLYSSVHKSTVHLWTDVGLSGVRKGNLDFFIYTMYIVAVFDEIHSIRYMVLIIQPEI